MNNAIIRYIIGQVIRLEGLLLAIPCVASIVYREHEAYSFLAVIAVCIVLGTLMTIKRPENQTIYLKEGCVATAFSWIILSVFGAFPYYLSGEIPTFVDALFESMSGFTTTGATVLCDVESMSRGMLLWRCFSQWIGGMGVLVFLLAVIPMNGGSHMNLMKAESPGPSVGKLVPKVKYTARILYTIYFLITILTFIFLMLGHMPFYDSLCTAFGTAATGGFGTKNDSLAGYSPYIQWVVIVFMTLSGVNFNFYYYMVFRNFKKALTMEEVRTYFIIMIAAILIIFANISGSVANTGEALRQAVFQVTAISSTTGYTTVDYNTWNQLSRAILMILMFIGACAGSTGCGMKVSRLVIMVKTVAKELDSYFHPKNVKKIKVDGKPVEHEVVRAVNVYFITFMILFVISVLLIAIENRDLVTGFTTVVACLNNIGVGLDGAGPGQNFAGFSVLSKLVMMFDMLAGRLELFPLLIIFSPIIYRDMAGSAAHAMKKKWQGRRNMIACAAVCAVVVSYLGTGIMSVLLADCSDRSGTVLSEKNVISQKIEDTMVPESGIRALPQTMERGVSREAGSLVLWLLVVLAVLLFSGCICVGRTAFFLLRGNGLCRSERFMMYIHKKDGKKRNLLINSRCNNNRIDKEKSYDNEYNCGNILCGSCCGRHILPV